MSGMTVCLWFDGCAEEAARFYAATLPDATLGHVHCAASDYPSGQEGNVLVAEFTVAGQPFIALNAGSGAAFTTAVSFQLHTENQAETDRLWDALTADGGEPGQCGWCKTGSASPGRWCRARSGAP